MIHKNVVYLGLTSFFTDMATAMINPILPIFVVVTLHEGMDKLGLVVAIATFVSYALRLLSGYISDRFGIVKPLVVAGYALSALSKPLIGFAHSYKSVAALRALERMGKALRSAPKDALLAHFGQKRAGRTFGFHKTLDIAGELTGSLLVFGLLWLWGSGEAQIRSIFFWTLLPGLIALFIVIFLVQDVPKRPKIQKWQLRAADKRVIKELGFYFLFLLFFFGEAFFTMRAKDVGIPIALIPLLFVLSTLTQTLTSYFSGILIDRFGALRILGLSYLFGLAALLALWPRQSLFVWIAYALLGLFMVFSLNAARAFIATAAKHKASVYGIFYAAVALCGAMGAYLVGWLWERFGVETALLYSTIGAGSVAVIYTIRIYFGLFRSR